MCTGMAVRGRCVAGAGMRKPATVTAKEASSIERSILRGMLDE